MIYFFDDYENFCAEKFLKILPENRIEKYNRLKRESDRDNCVAAYLLLRYALRENGIDSFETEVGANGKPFLKNKKMFFNISHCAEGVAVAVDTEPVGIDVQEIGIFNERVAKRFFTDGERKKINASSDKAKAFTRIWTLKESAIKNEGKALANLDKFSFENYENFFEKYGKKFSCLSEKNVLISVCGSKYFDEIKFVKTEDFI
ncbi:MAG TPA: hypothetical protein DIW36_01220 [Ruminococcaceae bacterium]|nr:hypothetical protein [Oscillospiraceae bacterium]